MEAANFWDERVFIPNRSLNRRLCVQNPNGLGDLITKNTVRWMLGADRNVWIRWLNPENTFYFSGQYFHTHIFDYDKGIANARPQQYPLPAPIRVSA